MICRGREGVVVRTSTRCVKAAIDWPANGASGSVILEELPEGGPGSLQKTCRPGCFRSGLKLIIVGSCNMADAFNGGGKIGVIDRLDHGGCAAPRWPRAVSRGAAKASCDRSMAIIRQRWCSSPMALRTSIPSSFGMKTSVNTRLGIIDRAAWIASSARSNCITS